MNKFRKITLYWINTILTPWIEHDYYFHTLKLFYVRDIKDLAISMVETLEELMVGLYMS